MRNSETTAPALENTFTDRADRNGVCVVDGYGISVRVARGRLVVRDGIGQQRRERLYGKVGHGLRRLIIMGHSGAVTLEALRWLHRVGVAFVHVDTDGRILTATAAAGSDDARLRRAQALAGTSATGLAITTHLLDAKLAGQAAVARSHLNATDVAQRIDRLRQQLATVEDVSDSREIEAEAAAAYFGAWPNCVALNWANKDRTRIPEHWSRFDGRRSPLTSGSANRAADPLNALLNYLYALAEIECRLACLTLGLDPGMGFLHVDAKARDSLALDLIEVVRPHIEAYVIELADGHIFRRADFIERDDGHCRILAPLAHRLAETMPRWESAVAPYAEAVAHTLADASDRAIRKHTPLTSAIRRRTATGSSASRRKQPSQRARTASMSATRSNASPLGRVCVDCGSPVTHRQRRYCPDCWPARQAAAALAGSMTAKSQLIDEIAKSARSNAIADGKRKAKEARARNLGWTRSDWEARIAPHVSALTLHQITSATGLSMTHASRIKSGKQVPDPRHWDALDRAIAERRTRSRPSGV